MTALEQLCQQVLEGKSWDYLKLPDRNIAQQLLNNGVMALNKDGILVTPLPNIWSPVKPTKHGTYWMRSIGKDNTMLVWIDPEGDVYPCECQSSGPYDMTKFGPSEWAELKEPE